MSPVYFGCVQVYWSSCSSRVSSNASNKTWRQSFSRCGKWTKDIKITENLGNMTCQQIYRKCVIMYFLYRFWSMHRIMEEKKKKKISSVRNCITSSFIRTCTYIYAYTDTRIHTHARRHMESCYIRFTSWCSQVKSNIYICGPSCKVMKQFSHMNNMPTYGRVKLFSKESDINR